MESFPDQREDMDTDTGIAMDLPTVPIRIDMPHTAVPVVHQERENQGKNIVQLGTTEGTSRI